MDTTLMPIRPAEQTRFVVACLTDRVNDWPACRRALGLGTPQEVTRVLANLFSPGSLYYMVLLGRATGRVPTALLVLQPLPWTAGLEVLLLPHPRHQRRPFTAAFWEQIEQTARALGAHRVELQVSADQDGFLKSLLERQEQTGLLLEGTQRQAVPGREGHWVDLHLFGKVLGE